MSYTSKAELQRRANEYRGRKLEVERIVLPHFISYRIMQLQAKPTFYSETPTPILEKMRDEGSKIIASAEKMLAGVLQNDHVSRYDSAMGFMQLDQRFINIALNERNKQ